MSDNHSITNELRARREALALSSSEVAARSGLDESALCAWETGETSPSFEGLQHWAAALGLKLSLAPSGDETRRGIRVEWDKRRITVEGVPVRLTPMEWRVVERLARTPGALVTHQELYRYIYNEDWPSRGQATAVRVLVTKLRRLLPLQIEARWGQGYILTGVEPSQLERAQDEPRPVAEPDRMACRERELPSVAAMPAPKVAPLGRLPMRSSLLRTGEAASRHAVVTAARPQPGRAEELGVIERFLSERGVTRCPDVRTIEKSPLPALVWDKVKRKWVRPAAAEACHAG
jgi:transcriptional regulator with XRE-family HTH domain